MLIRLQCMCGQYRELGFPNQIYRLNGSNLEYTTSPYLIVSCFTTVHQIEKYLTSGGSIVEMTAGIIVCCMPSAAAVYRCIKPRVAAFLSMNSHNASSINRNPLNHHYFNLQPAHSRNHDDTNAAGGKDGYHTTERTMTTCEGEWHQEANHNAYPLRNLSQI